MEMSGVGSELRNIFGCHSVFVWDCQGWWGRGTVQIHPLEEFPSWPGESCLGFQVRGPSNWRPVWSRGGVTERKKKPPGKCEEQQTGGRESHLHL